MKIVIISASQRAESQSAKVANYLAEIVQGFESINHIELYKQRLPLWDGEEISKMDNASDWLTINSELKKADAFILITPEWGGMASPLLKNFLLMCTSEDVAHKPTLLVSVVSGINGAYPIAELNMSAFKNNKLVSIPDHLIIRHVEDVLNTHTDKNKKLSDRDNSIRQRINYSLHTLTHYSKALKELRHNFAMQPYSGQENFNFGM